jgi:PTH1 family peptidyl-tRNA hydrolase
MKLIVGIGNPDPEYAATRHNVGWQFVDWLRKKHDGDAFETNQKLEAEVAKVNIDNVNAWLVKPQTYVNKSGDAVGKAAKWAKAKPGDVIVVHDDLDIPFGNCKLSFEKDSAGHKGVESVMRSLKTKKFFRIRIGTGTRAVDKARDQSDTKRDAFVKDFVLKKFTPSEHAELKAIFKACELRLLNALKS